jgi:Flp pilus assembly protein protease CpaA
VVLYAGAIICCAAAILLSVAGLYYGPSPLNAFTFFLAGLGLGASLSAIVHLRRDRSRMDRECEAWLRRLKHEEIDDFEDAR